MGLKRRCNSALGGPGQMQPGQMPMQRLLPDSPVIGRSGSRNTASKRQLRNIGLNAHHVSSE